VKGRKNGGEEEKKKEKGFGKMKEMGKKLLLYACLGRVDPNPTHSLLFVAI